MSAVDHTRETPAGRLWNRAATVIVAATAAILILCTLLLVLNKQLAHPLFSLETQYRMFLAVVGLLVLLFGVGMPLGFVQRRIPAKSLVSPEEKRRQRLKHDLLALPIFALFPTYLVLVGGQGCRDATCVWIPLLTLWAIIAAIAAVRLVFYYRK